MSKQVEIPQGLKKLLKNSVDTIVKNRVGYATWEIEQNMNNLNDEVMHKESVILQLQKKIRREGNLQR